MPRIATIRSSTDLRLSSRARSLCAAVSDVYQESLRARAAYTGKGIYTVDASRTALPAASP